jgi:DNA-binding MarR family transcriptional regulator
MQNLLYGAEPAVVVCADSELGMTRWAEAIDAVGARASLTLPIAGAIERLNVHPPADMMLVDAADDGGDALDRLLDRLHGAAGSGYPSVVNVAPALIDIAVARAHHKDVTLLCDADGLERAAALGFALAARPQPAFHERGDDPPMQLRRLSEEVGRIARALATLSSTERGADILSLPVARGQPANVAMPGVAPIRAMIRARRLRDQFFDAELFADPAWDMLLDLLQARAERQPVAVSSLCIAAAVPPTTALRWIKRLTDEGLFVRTADPRDGRRVFIDLSDAAADAMAAYFHATARVGLSFA